jgi:hypothetical protein
MSKLNENGWYESYWMKVNYINDNRFGLLLICEKSFCVLINGEPIDFCMYERIENKFNNILTKNSTPKFKNFRFFINYLKNVFKIK